MKLLSMLRPAGPDRETLRRPRLLSAILAAAERQDLLEHLAAERTEKGTRRLDEKILQPRVAHRGEQLTELEHPRGQNEGDSNDFPMARIAEAEQKTGQSEGEQALESDRRRRGWPDVAGTQGHDCDGEEATPGRHSKDASHARTRISLADSRASASSGIVVGGSHNFHDIEPSLLTGRETGDFD